MTQTKVFVCPGNAGTALEEKLENISLDLNNFEEIADFCKNENIALVIIGPEQPLVMGMTDFLQAKNINTFGPSEAAAQLEGSKTCLLYTSPSPRDMRRSRMPSSA